MTSRSVRPATYSSTRNVEPSSSFAEVGRAGGVRMGEVRAGDGLALEARDEIGQALDVGVEHLDGDALAHPEVLAAVDGAHPAHREELVDPVAVRDDVADQRRRARLRRRVRARRVVRLVGLRVAGHRRGRRSIRAAELRLRRSIARPKAGRGSRVRPSMKIAILAAFCGRGARMRHLRRGAAVRSTARRLLARRRSLWRGHRARIRLDGRRSRPRPSRGPPRARGRQRRRGRTRGARWARRSGPTSRI